MNDDDHKYLISNRYLRTAIRVIVVVAIIGILILAWTSYSHAGTCDGMGIYSDSCQSCLKAAGSDSVSQLKHCYGDPSVAPSYSDPAPR
jgi:hypothetical protein